MKCGISIAAATAVTSLAATSAFADTSRWAGFYAGAHAGFGFGQTNFSSAGANNFGSGNASGSFAHNGGLGGIQAGYNFIAVDGLVVGLEGDISFSGIDGDAFFGGKNPQSDLDRVGTIRGRIGWAFDDFSMIYITGGVAFGDWNDSFVPFANRSFFSNVYTGWTIGTGFETFLAKNITFRIEYFYTDFGGEHFNWTDTTPLGPVSGIAEFEHDLHTVRVGFNVFFD